MTTAVATWGEADLIDALRLQYGEDADEARDVIQTWFDWGRGVAISKNDISGGLVFEQWLPEIDVQELTSGLNPSWHLIAVIPASPIPTVQ